MRNIYYIMIACLFFACDEKEENEVCHQVEYGKEFTMSINEAVCFPDGNSFEVKAIIDEFCCCLCQCSWVGELDILIETNQSGDKNLVSLGSSTLEREDEIFKGFEVNKIDYLYKNEPNSLPVCFEEFDVNEVELIFEISQK